MSILEHSMVFLDQLYFCFYHECLKHSTQMFVQCGVALFMLSTMQAMCRQYNKRSLLYTERSSEILRLLVNSTQIFVLVHMNIHEPEKAPQLLDHFSLFYSILHLYKKPLRPSPLVHTPQQPKFQREEEILVRRRVFFVEFIHQIRTLGLFFVLMSY